MSKILWCKIMEEFITLNFNEFTNKVEEKEEITDEELDNLVGDL